MLKTNNSDELFNFVHRHSKVKGTFLTPYQYVQSTCHRPVAEFFNQPRFCVEDKSNSALLKSEIYSCKEFSFLRLPNDE